MFCISAFWVAERVSFNLVVVSLDGMIVVLQSTSWFNFLDAQVPLLSRIVAKKYSK